MLEGVCEIVDNSLDAGASKIKIHIESNNDNTLRITFIDNGVGIPYLHLDSDGVLHQGIPYALTYGGRIKHNHTSMYQSPVGKFGWGLSQTASCLSSRTEVYSKTDSDDDWRYSYYDFKELEIDPDVLLPLEEFHVPPYFELPETGTIICMVKVESAEYKSPFAIHNLLVRNLGKTYRHFLDNNREIIISSREKGRPKETKIQISDPIMLMEDSREVKLVGKSILKEKIKIVFDHHHPLGPIHDGPGYAELIARFVRLDSEKIRKNLNLPLTGQGGVINKEIKEKLGIATDTSGFSLVRNGREIASGQTLGLFSRTPWYNYMRVELLHLKSNFPPAMILLLLCLY